MRSPISRIISRLTTFLVVLSVSHSACAADLAGKFGNFVSARDDLQNARIKFERDKTGTVAFMGGSITEMNGYRPMVCDLLKKRFPQTQFKFIDAGISSTTSTTGAFRLAHDVLDQGPVDLFFVEFAVNDDQDGHHTRAECIRGMEGIIRHARRVNPQMDIVLTYFVNETMLATLQEGKTPLTIEAHEAVAKHYNLPTINLAAEVAKEITAGELTWKKYGGVHPAPFGNAIAASMIDELISTDNWKAIRLDGTKAADYPLPAPLDPMNYERGRFIEPSEARIVKSWRLGVPDWKNLPGGKRARFTSIPMLWTTEAGAEAALGFEGTAVGAFVVAGPDAGIVEASIDGGDFRPIDLYHEYSKGLHYPRTVMLGTDLKPGKHTLMIRMSAESKSGGHAMRVMEFVAN